MNRQIKSPQKINPYAGHIILKFNADWMHESIMSEMTVCDVIKSKLNPSEHSLPGGFPAARSLRYKSISLIRSSRSNGTVCLDLKLWLWYRSADCSGPCTTLSVIMGRSGRFWKALQEEEEETSRNTAHNSVSGRTAMEPRSCWATTLHYSSSHILTAAACTWSKHRKTNENNCFIL